MAEIGFDLEKAAYFLKNDELVAIPTETVYGLAGNGLKNLTIEKIYKVKNRPGNNPLILHVPTFEGIEPIVKKIPEMALKLAQAYWPGPLTFVLPKQDHIPDLATGGLPTVAVRVPAHEMTRSLLSLLDFPLAAPSANLSNRISPTTAEHVAFQIGDKIPYILNGGQCTQGIESTIIGFEGNIPVIYRHGALSIEEIQKISSDVLIRNEHRKIVAPGMFSKHYAPKTRLIATRNIHKSLGGLEDQKLAVLTLTPEIHNCLNDSIHKACMSSNGDLFEAAHNLYDLLYKLDAMNFDCILVEYVPDTGIGISINDRLKRASV